MAKISKRKLLVTVVMDLTKEFSQEDLRAMKPIQLLEIAKDLFDEDAFLALGNLDGGSWSVRVVKEHRQRIVKRKAPK